MATKMEYRVGVNFAIFRSNPWNQFIVLLEICCKDTNIHENVENRIFDFWLHKAQNVRACHINDQQIDKAVKSFKQTDFLTAPFICRDNLLTIFVVYIASSILVL